MLKVTTYKESAPMGMHDNNDDIRAERGKITMPEKPIHLSGYLHGKAEHLADYDIPVFIDGEVMIEPEQDCMLVLDGDEHECIMVMWPDKEEFNFVGKPISGWLDPQNGELPRRRYRFLICLKTDEDALMYAHRCAKDQATCL